jgi:hypothetical protein
VGVPLVGALAVMVGVPLTGLTLGDPGVTVGVPVVGATAMEANVGAPVDGDTEWHPGKQWVFLWWEHWQWWWGFQ